MTGYEHVLFERRGRVLTITLNRPDHLNAAFGPLLREMSRMFWDAARDPDSDVIVLTGAGRAFCAGGDVKNMAKNRELIGYAATAADNRRMIGSLLECEKPVIAKVNGDAVGLGASVALLCDIVFAADSARIGDPHVKVGLVAGDGGAIAWPALIGHARAKHYLFTGELVEAPEAERIGLIHRALPAAELDAAVDAYADRLAAGATQAIRWTKQTINIGLRRAALGAVDAGIAYEGMTYAMDDHLEAAEAFRGRRKPQFRGR